MVELACSHLEAPEKGKTMDFTPLLQNPNAITDEDVRNFRMEVFGDGLVSIAEAEAVFAINNSVSSKCDAWVEFFVECLVDYTVNQAQPRGYISVANAEWLINQVKCDSHVNSHCELELLIKAIEKAEKCPQFLCTFVLDTVARAVVNGDGKLLADETLTKGVIGQPEVELLRRILFAYGGEGGLSISRAEAEILFDLNDQTIEAENHASWSDLFVKAIANHLMAISGYQSVDRQEAIRREAWLEDTQVDVAGTLANSLRNIGSLFSRQQFTDAFKTDHQRLQEAWAERNVQRQASASSAAQIDDDEGTWLAQRILRDGMMHENEKALLRFIKQESPMVHPAIKQLCEKVA